jgi:hypothetical protein
MLRLKLKLSLASILLLLTACQPIVRSEPMPTPVVWKIEYTPALNWLGSDFSACMEDQPHASILAFEEPAAALDPAGVDFAFRWGPAQDIAGYAAVAGWDELVMIVHPDNPVDAFTSTDVENIYAGRTRSWSNLNPSDAAVTGRIHVWVYPAGNDVMEVFAALFGNADQGDAVLYLAPHPDAMLQAISEDPAAVGFIPRRWLDERVRAVMIGDMEEEDQQQPILALSRAEPEGDRRAWLLCVQERLSVE